MRPVDEPPGADPRAGWCGEGRLDAGPYPIRGLPERTSFEKLFCVHDVVEIALSGRKCTARAWATNANIRMAGPKIMFGNAFTQGHTKKAKNGVSKKNAAPCPTTPSTTWLLLLQEGQRTVSMVEAAASFFSAKVIVLAAQCGQRYIWPR